MKKITFYLASFLMFAVFPVFAQFENSTLSEGIYRIQVNVDPFNGQFAYADTNTSNVRLQEVANASDFTFTKTGDTYINADMQTVDVWHIMAPGSRFVTLNNFNGAGTRLKHRQSGSRTGTEDETLWYILEDDTDPQNVIYRIFTAHTSAGTQPTGAEQTILAATSNSDGNFLNTQPTVTSPTNLRPNLTLVLQQTLSTNEENFSFSIFVSSPVLNNMTISGLNNKFNNVEVYDLLGNVVLKTGLEGLSALDLNISALSAGLYVIKLSGDNVIATKKIIKR